MMQVEQYWSHSFIPELIHRDGIVLDIGMHDGGFARLVAPCCRKVIGFEPDPVWRGKQDFPANVQVVEKAIAGKAGTVRLHVNREKCSSLHYADAQTKTVEVDSLTLAQALDLVPDDRVDLVKMDIEGEELAVLSQAPAQLFDRIVQMTVEFHDFMDPTSLPQIRTVIARLKSLGFYTVRFSWRNCGDFLFVNRKLARINPCQKVWIICRYKYLRGLWRIVKRRLSLGN